MYPILSIATGNIVRPNWRNAAVWLMTFLPLLTKIRSSAVGFSHEFCPEISSFCPQVSGCWTLFSMEALLSGTSCSIGGLDTTWLTIRPISFQLFLTQEKPAVVFFRSVNCAEWENVLKIVIHHFAEIFRIFRLFRWVLTWPCWYISNIFNLFGSDVQLLLVLPKEKVSS